ncbi:MAG: chorismate mutase [Mogibacterium sp.]|nr:chorismate mutase [Mogibacterium sp.]
MKDIIELREEIRAIDEQMAELFVRRMEVAGGVAEYKMAHGLAVEDLAQERHVIESRSVLVENDTLRPFYVQFLQDVMDVCKSWQRCIMHGQKIAFCAVKDDTAEAAVQKLFPDGVSVECASYAEAYHAVETGECDAAVLPFEVSYAGEVGRVLDLIFEGNLYINDVCEIRADEDRTRYVVMSRAANKLADADSDTAILVMFTVKDEIGSLAKAINVISAYGFNMSVMRSRPMSDLPWHYYFYAEMFGSDQADSGEKMMNALRAICPTVKVAGRYKV